MGKATKISAGHYEYRGFRIDDSRYGWQIMVGDLRGWASATNTLKGAIQRIDGWFEFYARGQLRNLLALRAMETLAAMACERGEKVACPDAHTCRHGIDS